ncbi:hypothetical protein DSM3645_06349 [Blastopirellula marina DSM 3645]|uniref:Uncharacterized protein n=1 Tax=Blastopirellula marina DSM 3645 TaxID=314230 RepID=A4A2P5_9BACT|nr:hypothetical protein DSM3645_06349 [Blastopirellula marina DSM 3645]
MRTIVIGPFCEPTVISVLGISLHSFQASGRFLQPAVEDVSLKLPVFYVNQTHPPLGRFAGHRAFYLDRSSGDGDGRSGENFAFCQFYGENRSNAVPPM